MDPDCIALAKQMREQGKSFDDIAALLRVGASSVKRALRASAAIGRDS
jgi:predicted transcriptional regulator